MLVNINIKLSFVLLVMFMKMKFIYDYNINEKVVMTNMIWILVKLRKSSIKIQY